MQQVESYVHDFKYVTAESALEWANKCFVTGARRAIADFLIAMEKDGVDLGNAQTRASLVKELLDIECPKHD